MRIYLENIKPENITIKKLRTIDMYFRKKQDYTEILSETGIYHIENDKVFRLAPKDGALQKIENSGLSVVVDNSSFEKIPILSQIPFEHSTVSLTRMNFSQHDKSNLLLCVEGVYTKKQGTDKYEDFVVVDFYFISPPHFPPFPPLEKVESNQKKLGRLDPNQKRLPAPTTSQVNMDSNLYTDDGRFWLQLFYSRFL